MMYLPFGEDHRKQYLCGLIVHLHKILSLPYAQAKKTRAT